MLLAVILAGAVTYACTARDVATVDSESAAITDDPTVTARTTCKDGTCWTCRDVPVANGYRTHCDAPCAPGSSADAGTYQCTGDAPASQCPPSGAGSTSDAPPDDTGHTCDAGGSSGGGSSGAGSSGGSSSGGSSSGGDNGGGGYTCSSGDTSTECSGPPKCNGGTYPNGATCLPCSGATCDQPACSVIPCCSGGGSSGGGGDTGGGGNGGGNGHGGGNGGGNGGHGGSSGGSSGSSSGSSGSSGGSGGTTGGGDSDAGGGYVYASGCTLTQGFWKNHPSAWPVTSLTIGGATYSESQAIALLQTAPKGDASLVLGHQLIASMLSAAGGASVPSSVNDALTQAQAWMSANADADGRLPYGVSSSSAAGATATSLSGALDTYNNGGSGVPHCN